MMKKKNEKYTDTFFDVHPLPIIGSSYKEERAYDSTRSAMSGLDEMDDEELINAFRTVEKENKNLRAQIEVKENNKKTDRYAVYSIKERIKNNEKYMGDIINTLSKRNDEKKIKSLIDKEKNVEEIAEVGNMLPQVPPTGILKKGTI